MAKKISIVTPLFNEEGNVVELCNRIAEVMKAQPYEYEHLCIDNSSTDRTVDLLRLRATEDSNLKVVINARNFGYVRSSFHGLLQASGDAVVLISSDLQDPPEIIPEFIERWESGYKSVLATKETSEESSIIFGLRRLYYKAVGLISEVPLVSNATGSGLFDREVVDILKTLKEPYPYFRGLISEIGFPIAKVPFVQPRRKRGVTSQNFYSLYDMAMLGITKHSKIPLRLVTIFGFAIACFSLLVAVGYFMAKILFWNSFEIGTAPLVIGLFFFSAVQMIFLGFIGEYVGNIQTQVRDLPLVVELERINFGEISAP